MEYSISSNPYNKDNSALILPRKKKSWNSFIHIDIAAAERMQILGEN